MPALRDSAVTMSDGRSLAFTEWGNPDGKAVMYCHGTPGSRLWCPDDAATLRAGVRLIIPDRPGIGRSEPLEGRTIADWPRDVEALADSLGLSTFAIVGVSAGGPYAAVCAALIPHRMSSVALVCSRGLTKYNWGERPDAIDEWDSDIRAEFGLAQIDPAAGAQLAADHFLQGYSPQELVRSIHEELQAAEGDRWFFEDPARTELFDAHLEENWRQGPGAMKWDLIDTLLPWGFRLADIAITVTIWHGSQDPWVTQDQIDFQVRTIPDSSLVVWPDSGHLGFVKHWAEILETLK